MANFERNVKLSTITTMVYTNLTFNYREIAEGVEIVDVEVPLTRKKKNPDIKKIKARKGAIISTRFENTFRGVITEPDVIKCKEIIRKYKEQKEFTAADRDFINKYGSSTSGTTSDVYQKGLKKIIANDRYFRNQTTLIIMMDNNKQLNVMIFSNSIKIVGCNSMEQAKEGIRILWRDHISRNPKMYMSSPGEEIKFTFVPAMINVQFQIGEFKIDRDALKKILNREKYEYLVHSASFMPTSTSVNIKLHKRRTVIPCDELYCENPLAEFEQRVVQFTRNPKKKSKTTVLVFFSASIIMSGQDMDSIREDYEEIMRVLKENEEEYKIRAD